jgi:hypothetical protein
MWVLVVKSVACGIAAEKKRFEPIAVSISAASVSRFVDWGLSR